MKMSVVTTSELHREPVNKVRVAFFGPKCSGKSYLVEQLTARILDLQLDITIQRISLKTLLQVELGFDGISSHETAHLLRRDYIMNKLMDKLNMDRDVIIVEDVRYNEEVHFLKEHGFQIARVDAPWHVRLQRLQKKQHNIVELLTDIKWLTHESELEMDLIDDVDFCSKNDSEAAQIIEKIINTI